jgi:HK97 family phage portal protein
MNKVKQILDILFPSQQKAAVFPTSPSSFQIVNGTIINSPDNKTSYLDNGYNINDIIYSIVQLITEKVKLAPWNVYKVTDEDALKSYQSIIQRKDLSADDIVRAKNFRKKALEPFDADGKLNELLKWPNEYQTFADLVADSSIYKLLTGDRLIWAELLSAGANTGKPQSLHLLPSDQVSIAVNNVWPLTIISYKIVTWGLQDIPKVNVMHDKYFNPNCDLQGSHLLGLAPLKAALGLTTRSNSENRAATMSYQNGGPRSIIFVDEPQYSGVEKGAEASAIKRILTSKEYVGSNNSNKLAASGYKIGVVPLGLSPVDLDIIESEKWSLRRFCNVFGGVPSQLLNDPDNKVYNNTVEGEKALTSRCAIPLLNSFRDQFNRKLSNDWGYKDKNIYVDFDLTVYTELQENMKEKWEWVKQLPVDNGYKLDLMGLDHPEGQEEFMKQILVPSGYELSESYGETETDRALAEGDEQIP